MPLTDHERARLADDLLTFIEQREAEQSPTASTTSP